MTHQGNDWPIFVDGMPGHSVPIPDVTMIAPYPPLCGASALPSGVAAYTALLTEALASQGASVHVVAPRLGGEREVAHSGGVTVERRFSRGPGALPRAVQIARRTGAPIVHVQHEVFLFGGPLSIPGLLPSLATLRGHRVGPVVTMHQVVDPSTVDRDFTRMHRVSIPPRAARFGLRGLQCSVGRLARAVVVHDPSFRRVLPHSSVIQHGVEQRDPGSSEAARARLGLHADRLAVLCFGFLSPYKGLEVALEAAEEAGPAIELVVAGGEHPRLAGVDDYALNLRRRYGSVARFVGYVPDGEVASWFAAADALLLPYPQPFSTSGPYAHALGYGTPILCSSALAACMSAPPEMVVPTDRKGLAARLLELAAHREQLEPLRLLARALAAGRSWESVAKQHLTIYEEVALANRTPGGSVRTRQLGR